MENERENKGKSEREIQVYGNNGLEFPTLFNYGRRKIREKTRSGRRKWRSSAPQSEECK